MSIADHFFIFMPKDLLLHRKHGAVTRHKSPTVPAVTDIERQLLQQQSRPRPSDRHRVVTFELWREHGFPSELSEGRLPSIHVHCQCSFFTSSPSPFTARRDFFLLRGVGYSPRDRRH